MVPCRCCCLYLPGSAPAQKRQWVCCTGLMWDTRWFPSWLFDMTPDEPSTVLLSSAFPHLAFAFCTVPFSLPSCSRGKCLPPARGSGQAPGFGHVSIFPSFVQISGWRTRQQDLLAMGWVTCTPGTCCTPAAPAASPPAAGLQVACPPASPAPTRVPAGLPGTQVPWVGGCQHVTV